MRKRFETIIVEKALVFRRELMECIKEKIQ